MNYKFFRSLKDNNVKDLYWLLFKPSPIKNCPEGFNIPLFPVEIIKEWEEQSQDYFESLKQHPSDLQHFVNRKKNYRLGFYAEALLSYFFQTFKDIQLLLQNYQISQDKQTIGEIDFVIGYKNRVFHLELAVKYYLLLPESGPNLAQNWIGPSRKDDLNKKLTKIESHQLPLGRHEKLIEVLPFSKNQKIESYFLLRGQFFSHDSVECSFLNQIPLPYYFKNEVRQENISKLLQRPDWLGSIDRSDQKENLNAISFSRPQMLKFTNNTIGFVVPDNWND